MNYAWAVWRKNGTQTVHGSDGGCDGGPGAQDRRSCRSIGRRLRERRFIKGVQYVNDLNWTKGLNPETGRPLEYNPKLDMQIYNPVARALRKQITKPGREKPLWMKAVTLCDVRLRGFSRSVGLFRTPQQRRALRAAGHLVSRRCIHGQQASSCSQS